MTSDDLPPEDTIQFVYDGECPICTLASRLYHIRQTVGHLQVINAREAGQHAILAEINAAGLNLDDGMVIKYRGSFYHGAQALQLMAQLGDSHDTFNRINRVFKNHRLAQLVYPLLRAGRNLAITIKGSGQINNLTKSS